MAKNIRKVGESLPLARTSLLATPSSGGHPRNAPIDTPIEAPYELPEGWKWCKQNEVCRLTDGEKKTDVSYPYLEVKYLRGNKEKDFVTSGKFIKAGTKVILVDGENSGEVFTVPEDGYMGSTFKALSIQNVDEKYLQFFIQTKKDLYRNNKKGSAIPHLNKDLFFNMPFPLPQNPAEQQRIVNRIETMFAKLDQAQEKAQNVVDSFETRKAAILHKAFTGELTANWRKENGVKDECWKEKTIGEICLVKGGKRVPKGMSLVKEKNEHPYLKAGNLKLGTVIDKDMEYVPNDVLKIIKNYTVSAGDVYITNVGACIGDCGIIPDCFDGANLTENAVKLTELQCHNSYLAKLLASNLVQQQIKSKIKSATLGKLSIDNIKQLQINIPSYIEQQEIVRILDTVLEKETRAKEAAQTVLDQIALLKKSILARAFRGEL